MMLLSLSNNHACVDNEQKKEPLMILDYNERINGAHMFDLNVKEFLSSVTIIISGIFMLLSRVNAVFLFWSLFLVFSRIQTVACAFHYQSNFIGSFFLYSPRRPTFSNLFHMRLYLLFIG